MFLTSMAGPWEEMSLLFSSYGGASLELNHAFETKIRFRFQVMLKSLGA